MTAYRRKLEHVSAVQLTQEAIASHVLDKTPLPDGCVIVRSSAHPPTRQVHYAVVALNTRDREPVAPGDWIVRENGAIRVVKPGVFAEMYEAEPPIDERDALRAEIARMAPVVAAADAWRDDPCKGLGSRREAALADAVDAYRRDAEWRHSDVCHYVPMLHPCTCKPRNDSAP